MGLAWRRPARGRDRGFAALVSLKTASAPAVHKCFLGINGCCCPHPGTVTEEGQAVVQSRATGAACDRRCQGRSIRSVRPPVRTRQRIARAGIRSGSATLSGGPVPVLTASPTRGIRRRPCMSPSHRPAILLYVRGHDERYGVDEAGLVAHNALGPRWLTSQAWRGFCASPDGLVWHTVSRGTD
jgi:hypothetical protein